MQRPHKNFASFSWLTCSLAQLNPLRIYMNIYMFEAYNNSTNRNTVIDGPCILITYSLIAWSGYVNRKPFISQSTSSKTNICNNKSGSVYLVEVFLKSTLTHYPELKAM